MPHDAALPVLITNRTTSGLAYQRAGYIVHHVSDKIMAKGTIRVKYLNLALFKAIGEAAV